ncbi:ribonuclease H-like domain-containing protein [Candidatus Nitrospira salsa]
MNRKYLAFDIETAKILPEDFGELLAHRPLGICCTATWASQEDAAQRFYSRNPDGTPAAQMNQEDLSAFVDFLQQQVKNGWTIVTLNGLGFDFDILGEESNRMEDCRHLARNHVDMLFHIFCKKGFGVGLNAAAKAIGLSKPENVDGSVAPQLWKDGQHQQVLDYVAQDCRLTLDIAETSEKTNTFRWITRKGTTAYVDIPSGWQSVEEAMTRPLPDTSWMDKPWPRSKFTDWLNPSS